jgi:hypothetical protein
MRRIAILNLAFGFGLIFVAACGGAFVALKSTESYLQGVTSPQWETMLQASSHGHTNLFGVIHILLGLTLPYTRSTLLLDRLKTFALMAGSLAMGPLLLVRAHLGPSLSTDGIGLVIGTCLTLALAAILAHTLGLFSRFIER